MTAFVQVLADPALTSWPLRSLTLGPFIQKDNLWFDRALDLNPNFPYLETITILGYYKTLNQGPPTFLRTLDQILSREHTFPRLNRLDIRINTGPNRLRYHRGILQHLPTLRAAAKVSFWG
jgi:hypothetical protein